MQIVVSDASEACRYEARTEVGTVAAFVDYERGEGIVRLTHTKVMAGFAGKGIPTRMICSVLADIRSRGEHVVPVCPFVQALIAKNSDYSDLVAIT